MTDEQRVAFINEFWTDAMGQSDVLQEIRDACPMDVFHMVHVIQMTSEGFTCFQMSQNSHLEGQLHPSKRQQQFQ